MGNCKSVLGRGARALGALALVSSQENPRLSRSNFVVRNAPLSLPVKSTLFCTFKKALAPKKYFIQGANNQSAAAPPSPPRHLP